MVQGETDQKNESEILEGKNYWDKTRIEKVSKKIVDFAKNIKNMLENKNNLQLDSCLYSLTTAYFLLLVISLFGKGTEALKDR